MVIAVVAVALTVGLVGAGVWTWRGTKQGGHNLAGTSASALPRWLARCGALRLRALSPRPGISRGLPQLSAQRLFLRCTDRILAGTAHLSQARTRRTQTPPTTNTPRQKTTPPNQTTPTPTRATTLTPMPLARAPKPRTPRWTTPRPGSHPSTSTRRQWMRSVHARGVRCTWSPGRRIKGWSRMPGTTCPTYALGSRHSTCNPQRPLLCTQCWYEWRGRRVSDGW